MMMITLQLNQSFKTSMLSQFKNQRKLPGSRTQLEEGRQRYQQQHIRHHVSLSRKNIYDNLREEYTNEKSTILNNSSNDDVLGQDDRITSSIVRASNKVNFDVAKIVVNSSPLLPNDTINGFLSPQEARHDDTPLRSNTVVKAKNTPVIPIDEIESDNDSSGGIPHLL